MPQEMEVRFNFFQIIYHGQNIQNLQNILHTQLSLPIANRYSPHVNGAERVLLDKTMSIQGCIKHGCLLISGCKASPGYCEEMAVLKV